MSNHLSFPASTRNPVLQFLGLRKTPTLAAGYLPLFGIGLGLMFTGLAYAQEGVEVTAETSVPTQEVPSDGLGFAPDSPAEFAVQPAIEPLTANSVDVGGAPSKPSTEIEEPSIFQSPEPVPLESESGQKGLDELRIDPVSAYGDSATPTMATSRNALAKVALLVYVIPGRRW